MKKKIFVILLTPFIIISVLISIDLVNNRILSNNFKDESIEIFVPSGMANKYKDVMKMSFDDRRIWIYSLNENEIEQINEDIKSEPWRKFREGFKTEAEFYFSEEYWPENLSDKLYYCLYDMRMNEFIYFDTDADILGWHRLLFLYDSAKHKYYCVSMSI